ncbi:MAG: type I-D CRISPR-associated helicase Cas3' [Spirulinaceae cyanobacterium]
MSEYTVTLKPVYSAPATELPEGIKLPKGWTLSWHQLETLKAIRDPEIDVVFNTAMTGDGKSLAAYLDTLQGESYGIALYPTNELARDQEKQVYDYIKKFQPKHNPRVNRLSGEDLEIYADKEGLRKRAALESRTSNSEILLANPDIFHYLHRSKYLMFGDSPDRLWNKIDKRFDLFIFDEFHVFAAPQVASVINTMLLIRYTNRQKKFLFLSATPSPEFVGRLQDAGFRCREIDPVAEDKYRFAATPGWRLVTREINLKFISLESKSKASEVWIKENGELIVNRFLTSPGSKGAVILNSIAAVKRLTPWLRKLLQPYNLTVGENTGLSGKKEKLESLSADLVIGTSTIDVGVDFKINFLIFEAADAGNFIQRLGRLGRHGGYGDIEFKEFTAYALVPNFLVGRLFLVDSPPLESGGVCDRIFFHNQIKENYRKINDFHHYYSRWGAVQSMVLCRQLGAPTIRQQYAGSQQAFKAACEKIFNANLKRVFGRSKAWEKEWLQLSGKKKGNPILEDAASFRGSSPLQCGIYDLTENNEADRFKTYSLPGILSNLVVEPMTKAAYLRQLGETVKDLDEPIAKGRFSYCLAFLKLHEYREERLNWKFTYPGDLKPLVDAWKVQVLLGLQVWQPDNYWISKLNQRLKLEGLVCYLLPRPVAEVRMRLQLPMHFQIHPICDDTSLHDSTAPYSICFGQSALLVDILAYRLKSRGEEIWVC